MEIQKLWLHRASAPNRSRPSGQSGFALVSLVVLVPLVMALLMALGVTFTVLKRKSLAQAICVQEAASLQERLKAPLKKLLRMNQEAQTLRARRLAADQGLASATASGIPYAIAAAKANQLAVIAQQLAFQSRQWALLLEARRLRLEGQQALRLRASRIGGFSIETPTGYFRALAVEPRPLSSLSPDYVKIVWFARGQEQRYRFRLNLLHLWPGLPVDFSNTQTTECSVTLKGDKQQWDLEILAAKASSNS